MYNIPYPYMYPQINNNQLQEEIKRLQYEIERIKERLAILEENKKQDYLKNDDNFHML